MRRPISTSSGLVTFGRSSPITIRQRFSPTTSAALMKSRSTTSWPAPRMTRATRGAWVRPTVTTTISHSFGPIAETASSDEDDLPGTPAGRRCRASARRRASCASTPRRARRRSRGRCRRWSRRPTIQRTVSPPCRKRLKTSRPSASAPNSAFADGPAFGAATNSVGECGATNGPKTAIGDHEDARSRGRCACA